MPRLYNPITKKIITNPNLLELLGERGYSDPRWVTAKQAELLGGFEDDFILGKNGYEKRPTDKTSIPHYSGVLAAEVKNGVTFSFYVVKEDKSGQTRRFAKSVTYYNVGAHCWGNRTKLVKV